MLYVIFCMALFGWTMKGQGKMDALYVKGCDFVCCNVTSSVEKRDAFLAALQKIHAGSTYVLALLFGIIGVGLPLSDGGESYLLLGAGMLVGAGVFILWARTNEKRAIS